jgi:hypothetical protein
VFALLVHASTLLCTRQVMGDLVDEVDLVEEPVVKVATPRNRGKVPVVVSPEVKHVTGLTASQQESFESYVAATAEALGLHGWELIIKWDEPASDDANAEVAVVEGRNAATIHPGLELDQMTKDEMARVVIHELLHCHLAASKYMMMASIKEHVSPSVLKSTEAQASLMEEYVVDRLSSALADWLPGPTFLKVAESTFAA